MVDALKLGIRILLRRVIEHILFAASSPGTSQKKKIAQTFTKQIANLNKLIIFMQNGRGLDSGKPKFMFTIVSSSTNDNMSLIKTHRTTVVYTYFGMFRMGHTVSLIRTVRC